MALLNVVAQLDGLVNELYQLRVVGIRIAEALERIAPPLPDISESRPVGAASPDEGFHLAESPAEYQERIDSEAAFAASLGVAPWSPEFQRTIMEMRQELMKPRREYDEETATWTDRELTEEEASEAVRAGFRAAKAEANER